MNEFEAVYLHNVSAVSGMPTMNKINWLQNNIVWKLVDGQHIVAACLQTRREHQAGLMSDEEFMTKYAQRKAKFIVFNKPKLYIEASIMINAKEFERKFYTTMYEDMMKLHAI